MLYLLSVFLSVIAVSADTNAQRRLSPIGVVGTGVVVNHAMEQQLLDNIAFQTALGAYDGIKQYFGMARRLEDPSERLNHVIAKVDETPRRRIVCLGLCIAIAAAVAGGVAGGVTTGAIGLIGNAISNSVEAPNFDVTPAQVEQLAELAAQGAFDAVETQFGIQGIEAFGDHLAQAMSMHRRPACLGLCTAIIAAVIGGVTSGVAGGLVGLAGNSVSAEDFNIDAGLEISQMALEQVANIEKLTIDLISQIGSQGAINALQNLAN